MLYRLKNYGAKILITQQKKLKNLVNGAKVLKRQF